ncbi:unnamed protein product [Allacma fusca]|uniref:Uncharacterized protein n=1 Tax=Allacma fusca TaxID=39272 RepID=A0A8J2PI04_9HEXA|nr:unnamed protein product [Allacma fusca]
MSVRFFLQFCFGSILLQLAVTAVLSSNGDKYDSCGLLTSNVTSRQQTKFNFQLLGYDYDNLPIGSTSETA